MAARDKRYIVRRVVAFGGTADVGEHDTRGAAERDASARSRKDSAAWGYEIRDRKSPIEGGKPWEYHWVSIYKRGWLNDANLRGSYQPEDQKRNSEKLERDFQAMKRARRRGEATSGDRRRRSGNYEPQAIRLPGSQPGRVNVVLVDPKGTQIAVLHRNLTNDKARELILKRWQEQTGVKH